jgi:hypothetical protein
MSEQGTIYGCIFAGGLNGGILADYVRTLEINKAVIDALPDKVDENKNIYLTRQTFSVPMIYYGADPNPPTPFYRRQMIHFGASFNHLHVDWGDWLEQFESLLRQMYWFEAYVHMKAEARADDVYHWKANLEPMFEKPARPVETWTFTGGPRTFDVL